MNKNGQNINTTKNQCWEAHINIFFFPIGSKLELACSRFFGEKIKPYKLLLSPKLTCDLWKIVFWAFRVHHAFLLFFLTYNIWLYAMELDSIQHYVLTSDWTQCYAKTFDAMLYYIKKYKLTLVVLLCYSTLHHATSFWINDDSVIISLMLVSL